MKNEMEKTWVEFNELVFNRENPKYIYKAKNCLQIFDNLRKGDLVYYKRDNMIWSGKIVRKSGRIGLDVSNY